MKHKVLHEDDKSFHVQHPDGSTFKIAKAKLDDTTIGKIRGYADGGEVKKQQQPDSAATAITQSFSDATGTKAITDALKSILPKYADGGDTTPAYLAQNAPKDPLTGLPMGYVPPDAPAAAAPEPDTVVNPDGVKSLMSAGRMILDPAGYLGSKLADNVISGVSQIPGYLKGLVTMPNPKKVASADTPVSMESAPTDYSGKPQISAPSPSPSSPTGPTEMQKAQAMQESGIMGMTKAQTELGNAQAKIYADEASNLKDEKYNYDLKKRDLDNRTESLFQNALTQKVNPNQYWENMSVPNRILANISIALGGVAGGISGKGGNMALDQINKQIDKDIDSQKANMNQGNNLLSKNLDITHDLDQATALTRSQLTAITGAMVASTTASATAPEAAANGQMLLGKLKEQAAQQNAQLAMMYAKSNLGAGGGQTLNPESLSKDDRERLVTLPNGQQRLAYSSEGAKDTREKLATATPILNKLDQLDALGPQALIPGSKENQKADAIRAVLVPMVNEFSKINRLSEEDVKIMSRAISDPSSFRQLAGGRERSDVLRDTIADKLQSHLASNLEGGYKPSAKLKSATPYVAAK